MEKKFEKASRMGLTVQTSYGMADMTALWDCELDELNRVAVRLHKEIEEAGSMNFLNKSSVPTKTKLSFEIVKYMIETRLEEVDNRKTAATKKIMREKIALAIDAKKDADLSSMSVEDLEAMMNNV